jgi:hypothetical protein
MLLTVTDPWSITLTSVTSGTCMSVTGILLVSSGLIAISLIPSTAEISYIAMGILAGNLNCTDVHIFKK